MICIARRLGWLPEIIWFGKDLTQLIIAWTLIRGLKKGVPSFQLATLIIMAWSQIRGLKKNFINYFSKVGCPINLFSLIIS